MKTKKITLNELRTLVKQIIKEYDTEKIERNYPNLPDERKEKIKDFLIKRQTEQGYVLNGLGNLKNNKFFLTRNGITNMTPIKISNYNLDTNIFRTASNVIEILKNVGYNSSSQSEISKKYGFNPEVIIDLSNEPFNIKDSIKVDFSVSMRNVLTYSTGLDDRENTINTKTPDTLDFVIKLYGTLNKKNDKYNPPFKLHINRIKITNNSGIDIIPSDNKTKNFIISRISEIVKEKYKFSNNKDIFIDDVVIDRNSFYK